VVGGEGLWGEFCVFFDAFLGKGEGVEVWSVGDGGLVRDGVGRFVEGDLRGCEGISIWLIVSRWLFERRGNVRMPSSFTLVSKPWQLDPI